MQNASNKKSGFEIFRELTRRHLLVFFNNKVRVMYTLIVPVVIFAVYILFLRDLELSTVQNILYELQMNGSNFKVDGQMTTYINTLVDSWMLSGIAALSTITVALQTNTVFVEDKQNGVNRDFISSPIPRGALVGSYFLYNFIVTVLICLVYLGVCFIYFAVMGEFLLTALNLLEILGVLLYTSVTSTLMTVFVCSFINSEGTMASVIAIFSTVVGFLIGAYMPLGMLPEWLQTVCGFIPGTYACSLMRYAFMGTPIQLLSEYVSALGVAEGSALVEQLTASFGYQLNVFGVAVSPLFQAIANLAFILIFLLCNVLAGKNLSAVLGVGKKQKKKRK